MMADHQVYKPLAKIRRFDIYVEYCFQERLRYGLPIGVAKGEALWLGKVAAARRRGYVWATRPREARWPPLTQGVTKDGHRVGWKTLKGVPQTDVLFDEEIVERMGKDFYYNVFSPTIRYRFLARGERYMQMRNELVTVMNSPKGLPYARREGS